jgi:hypothetical protein
MAGEQTNRAEALNHVTLPDDVTESTFARATAIDWHSVCDDDDGADASDECREYSAAMSRAIAMTTNEQVVNKSYVATVTVETVHNDGKKDDERRQQQVATVNDRELVYTQHEPITAAPSREHNAEAQSSLDAQRVMVKNDKDDNKDEALTNKDGDGAAGGEEDDDEEEEGEEENKQRSPHLEALMFSVVSSAVGVASKAASGAFSTLKDVYHTLQAKNTNSPPRSTWSPPHDTWTPSNECLPVQPHPTHWSPQNQPWTPAPNHWIPSSQPWTPASHQWTPSAQPWTPSAAQPWTSLQAADPAQFVAVNADEPFVAPSPVGPMEQLVEMGFANRELNAELLAACNGEVEMVIQELIHAGDDWPSTRH